MTEALRRSARHAQVADPATRSNGRRGELRGADRSGELGAPRPPVACDCPAELINLPLLLEGMCDPAAIIGGDFRIVAANQAYRDKFNHGVKVCGHHCFEVSHHLALPCSQTGESCPIERAREGRTRARALHVHHTCDGEEHELVTIHPLSDSADRVDAFLEILSPARVASSRARGDDGLVGHSPAFNRMLELLSRAAPASTTVLLLGESGTGKELVARALHDMSPRARGPFVPVDCSGLTESLFESELFGHEKGSFTGAVGRKRGLVEAADGGTLFLDEVGDIPLSLQVKLLRLLETGVFRRVGNTEQLHSDFRLVCATHRDLRKMVDEGAFRADLFYRISAFPVELPPLRERREDIALLLDALLDRIGCTHIAEIHPDTLEILESYSFPGNVRELYNIVERACLLADGDTLLPEHLPSDCCEGTRHAGPLPRLGRELLPLQEMETRYLEWALSHFRGERSELAARLGLSERTLYRKLRLVKNGDGDEPDQ